MRYLSLLVISVILLAGCSSEPSIPETKTASGVPYEIHTDAEGPTAKEGDFVAVHYAYTAANDSTFYNTFKNQSSLSRVESADGYGDQDEWLQMLSEGDSATFYVLADSMFRIARPPAFIKRGEYVRATVKLEKIMNETAYVSIKEGREKQKIEHELQVIRAWLDERGIEYQEAPSGVIYTVDDPGEGEQPSSGDRVKVHYTGRLLDGQEFDSSVGRGKPYEFVVNESSVITGWHKGIPLFHEGAKGTIYLAPSLGYGKQGSGMIPPNSPLIFDIELVDVIDPLGQQKEEAPLLEAFIEDNGWPIQRTDEYLYYVIHEEGTGTAPRPGQTVTVHYTGKLLNGNKFDSSVDRGQPFKFVLGQGQVIRGWDIGIGMLKPGAKATLIIPSPLGYGERGSPPRIPPNSPLVFDVELIAVQ